MSKEAKKNEAEGKAMTETMTKSSSGVLRAKTRVKNSTDNDKNEGKKKSEKNGKINKVAAKDNIEITNKEKLIDICRYPVVNVLNILLKDKSTKRNIIWATDSYEEYGERFFDNEQLYTKELLKRPDIICPRIQKSQETQAERTRKKAEVFTPAWLCNEMNNYCDEEWFGRKDVFNFENGHTWKAREEKIEFSGKKKWQQYVDLRKLEITCGEAPFLVSRYDTSTGSLIVPPKNRIGIVDRKLRIVDENTEKYDDWLKWVFRSFESSYGYEYQGDNLLIARINMLMTFVDYYRERWEKDPDEKLLKQIANKIVWNVWQMDGLKDTVPYGKLYNSYRQLSLADLFDDKKFDLVEDDPEIVYCKIYNWRSASSVKFRDLKVE